MGNPLPNYSMDELTDNLLIQRIETVFWPGKDWETSQFQLTTVQVSQKLQEVYPGYFTDIFHLSDLLEQMHVPYSLNEHNGKHYWLLNTSLNILP